jgi:hypothetical protein
VLTLYIKGKKYRVREFPTGPHRLTPADSVVAEIAPVQVETRLIQFDPLPGAPTPATWEEWRTAVDRWHSEHGTEIEAMRAAPVTAMSEKGYWMPLAKKGDVKKFLKGEL